jgi:hypothetical protein
MDVGTWKGSRKRERRETLLKIVPTVHTNVKTIAIDFCFETQASQGQILSPRPSH